MAMEGAESLGVSGWMFSVCFRGIASRWPGCAMILRCCCAEKEARKRKVL